MPNPYATSSNIDNSRGIFADFARLRRSSFLYREIEFDEPFSGRMVYSGWWFWQRVNVGGQRVWSRVSWITIDRELEFLLPAAVDPGCSPCRIEIEFSRGLQIRRFRIWIAGQIVFDEIN
ncbi:MAG: hypothetical protein HKN47_01745 [Pirellulaceae bacterium]|nr:hypothetical protein [Pirellulaceae bacterium]